MKETIQNINDFIAVLAEDIEGIKTMLKSRGADSDKILQQLQQALEPLQTLCNDRTKEMKAYQLSLAQAIVQTLIEKLGGKEIPAPTQDSLHRESVFPGSSPYGRNASCCWQIALPAGNATPILCAGLAYLSYLLPCSALVGCNGIVTATRTPAYASRCRQISCR